MYDYLCACDRGFLEALIKGQVALKAKENRQTAAVYDAAHSIQHRGQGIYYNTLVRISDGRGHSYEQLRELTDTVFNYASGELKWEEVRQIDRVWLSGACNLTEADYRSDKSRYVENKSQKGYALGWVQYVRDKILTPAEKVYGHNHSFAEVGWAKAVVERSTAHITHRGTNSLWGLITAVSEHLFDQGPGKEFEIVQYTLCKVVDQEHANMCESLFSSLCSSYHFMGGANPARDGSIQLKDFEGLVEGHWMANAEKLIMSAPAGRAADRAAVEKARDEWREINRLPEMKKEAKEKIQGLIGKVDKMPNESTLRLAAATQKLKSIAARLPPRVKRGPPVEPERASGQDVVSEVESIERASEEVAGDDAKAGSPELPIKFLKAGPPL